MNENTSAPFPLGGGSVTLATRRGQPVLIRHILPSDDALLVDLFERMSPETRRLRFMSQRREVPADEVWREAARLSHIDPLVQAALIGVVGEEGRPRAVGVARLALEAPRADSAEFAIVIRDDYQGAGLGTMLFDLLIQVALVRGLRRLDAVALAENVGLARLIRKTGLPYTTRTSYGEMRVSILLHEA